EISAIAANSSSVWKNGNSPQYGNNMGSLQETLGANNYNWGVSTGPSNIWKSSWSEYSAAGNHYIANGPMESIGELGFIYDPARYDFNWYRSNAKTLRVGQPDAPEYNRNKNSTATDDKNWLGGLGDSDITKTNYFKSAFLLVNLFRVDDKDSGKINPNGFLRSSDTVLLDALFKDFEFNASGASNAMMASGTLSSKTLNTNAFYETVLDDLSSNRPFVGVGDVSRLAVFATSATTNSIAENQDMSDYTVSDSDREEVYRRTVGLLSTQSLAYTVYVIGQSGKFAKDKSGNDFFQVTSTVKRATVIQAIPNYSSTTYPAKPDSWTIKKPWSMTLN
ncbi:MAG: hypothetical protein ACK5LK_06515, partial [Chthoniobacterales bacterium]